MSDKYGYIGIETLLNFCSNQKDHCVTPNDFMRMNRVKIDERPHGKWIDVNGDGSIMKCSICGDKVCCKGNNFCPNCGSDNRPRENNSSSMIINGKYSENVEYGTRIEIGKMKGR